jgi:hypothetical protein
MNAKLALIQNALSVPSVIRVEVWRENGSDLKQLKRIQLLKDSPSPLRTLNAWSKEVQEEVLDLLKKVVGK